MSLRKLLVAAIFLAFAMPAVASAEPPAKVPVQAYLTNAQGVPVDSQMTITAKIYDQKTGGTALHTEQLTVTPKAGSFTAYLGTNKTLDLSIFQNNKNLYFGMTINGSELSPRLQIATAPYAASAGFAQNAAKVGGKDPSQIGKSYMAGNGLTLNNQTFEVDPSTYQKRISGQCSSGKFAVGVQQDGSVICQQPSSNVQAGTGLQKSSNTMSIDPTATQQRVTGNCSGNQKIIGINQDGTVQCASDATGGGDITEVAAGNGLSGGAKQGKATLDIASGGITASMIAAGTITGDKLSTNIESSEIEFIGSGSNKRLVVASNSIHSADIASNTVDQGNIGSGAVGTSELRGNAVKSAQIDDGTITGDDIGDYECDSGTQFEELSYPSTSDCPYASGGGSIPGCDEVPVGGVCEADGACANTSGSADNCGPGAYDIYIRTSW